MKKLGIVLAILVCVTGLSFAEGSGIAFSGGFGVYGYFSEDAFNELYSGSNSDVNALDAWRIGGEVELGFKFSDSFALGAGAGIYFNTNVLLLFLGVVEMDIPLYAFARFKFGPLFLQAQAGAIFDIFMFDPNSEVLYVVESNTDASFFLNGLSWDMTGKIGINFGGMAIYARIGVILNSFSEIAILNDTFKFVLGAGLSFGI